MSCEATTKGGGEIQILLYYPNLTELTYFSSGVPYLISLTQAYSTLLPRPLISLFSPDNCTRNTISRHQEAALLQSLLTLLLLLIIIPL